MTTTTLSYHPVRFPFLLIFVIVAAVGIGLAITHADVRHPNEAATVRQCLDQGNKIEVWFNPVNNHRIELCQVDKNLYGMRVLKNVDGKWQEVTAFLKAKMKDLADVERYLSNSGAEKIWVK